MHAAQLYVQSQLHAQVQPLPQAAGRMLRPLIPFLHWIARTFAATRTFHIFTVFCKKSLTPAGAGVCILNAASKGTTD